MLIKIVSVSIERIKKAKSDYSIATVIYTFNGQARTQKVISFANPSVFAKVQEWEVALPEGEINVEVGKNDAGYNEWRSIGETNGNTNAPSANNATAPTTASNTSRTVAVSNYETREERAARQVLIVKQSSLTAALKFVELSGELPADRDNVVVIAQAFADWVFDNGGNA